MNNQLQKRPLPSLEDTLGNFLDNVEPLLSQEEFAHTGRLSRQLLSGPGPALQAKLEELQTRNGQANWNAGFWDSMYLNSRDPLPINSSPFFAVSDQEILKGLPLETLSSKIVHATNAVISSIRNKTLAPDYSKQQIQDMVQYERLFGYCRVPKQQRDEKRIFPYSNHICVLYRNRIFSVRVFDDDTNPIPLGDLERNFIQIIGLCEGADSGAGFIGYCTADNRDRWAQTREDIKSVSLANCKALGTLEESLYVMCLDDTPITGLTDRAERLLHNHGRNRYFDKYQIVISSDGKIASIFEHAPVDAITVGRVWNETIGHLTGQQSEPQDHTDSKDSAVLYSELEFELTSPIAEQLQTSRDVFEHFSGNTQIDVVLFDSFGSNAVKTLGVSPDACLQLLFQLSYFRAFGEIENTYESVSTRQFVEGRTDVLRPVTAESVDFVKNCVECSTEQALELLKKAVGSIVERRRISANGESPDHHLSALGQIARQQQNNCFNFELPALFQASSYQRYTRTIMSTSNISDPLCLMFGFGPVSPDGLGIAYGTHSEHFIFHLSFFDQNRGRIDRFRKELLTSLQYLGELLPVPM